MKKRKQRSKIGSSVKYPKQNKFVIDDDQNYVKPDIGYNNAFWMKISDDMAIGFGEMEGTHGPPEEIKAWVFNEFTKEAEQLGTKVVDFEVKARLKCLQKLEGSVRKQIKILENQETTIPGSNNDKNQRNSENHPHNKKHTRSGSSRS